MVEIQKLIGMALGFAQWYYCDLVRKRMGLPDDAESMRKVLGFKDEQLAEFLSDAEYSHYKEYRDLRYAWDDDYKPVLKIVPRED